MRKLISIVLGSLLSIAVPVPYAVPQTSRSANFTYRYDLDSTTLTYCKVVGQNGSVYGGSIAGTARIKTTGSTVDIDAVTAGQAPFASIDTNDVLIVQRPNGTVDVRVVTAKTDSDNLEVHTAVNWDTTTGFAFRWLDTQCGTGDTDGWVDASGLSAKAVTFLLEQASGVTGGIDVRVECRGQALGSLPNPIHPGADTDAKCGPGTLASQFCNFTTAGATTGRLEVAIPQDIVCPQVRIGVKIGTSDAAEAAEADRERVTMTFESEAR